jgi:hypothetical protein
MPHWAAAINGRRRNSSLHPRHCSDILVLASCCRNWACRGVALRSALLFLYRAAPVCSCICMRRRVQFPTSAGISLADVASDHSSRRCSCVLSVHSAIRNERSETNSASVTGEKSLLHSSTDSRKTVLLSLTCVQTASFRGLFW